LGRVYTGVGTAAPYGVDGLPQERTQRPIEYLLHGLCIGLDLPAVIGAAIESDLNEIPAVGVFHGDKDKDYAVVMHDGTVTLTLFTPLGSFRA